MKNDVITIIAEILINENDECLAGGEDLENSAFKNVPNRELLKIQCLRTYQTMN